MKLFDIHDPGKNVQWLWEIYFITESPIPLKMSKNIISCWVLSERVGQSFVIMEPITTMSGVS